MIKLSAHAADRGAVHAMKAGRPSCEPAGIKADLHLHSTFSDGVKTPAELCRMAKKAGIAALSLTDHDTAAGLASMRQVAETEGLLLLEGTEVSTGESGAVHVLGYGPAVGSEKMAQWLKHIASDRVSRAERILNLLEKQGVFLSVQQRETLLQNSGVGRAHIARAMVEAGAVSTVRQAFDRYLSQGKCAYAPRQLPSTAEAVYTMRQLGVTPVLAHPLKTGQDLPALSALLREWKGCGLMGVEAYHTSVHTRAARQLEALGRELELLITGGSDYHGDAESTVHIGRLPAGWTNCAKDVQALMEATHM